MTFGDDYEKLTKEDLLSLLRRRDAEDAKGTRLRYAGQRLPWQLVREVKPRRQRLDQKIAEPEGVEHSDNLVLEGENLQGMVSLYKYKGQVDLVLTDPPYNTGRDFRYNDRWDTDPNDSDLGRLVSEEDGSRHAKWLRFMHPRVWMMKEMLRPGGVLAICIDHRELYRLGLLLDQVFGEHNRLGVINWQKTTPKSTTGHLSVVTEYVLVYAKGKDRAKTADVERSTKADARFGNIDNDRLGEWKQGDLTAPDPSGNANYAIQSPFTGEFHTPGNRHWSHKRSQMKLWLCEWGSDYEDYDLKDERGKALALKGWKAAKTPANRAAVIDAARKRAEAKLVNGSWPLLYWGVDGLQKPVRKNYKEQVRMGAVPTNLWVEEDELPPPDDLQAITWLAAQSGRTRDGGDTLTEIMGKNHGFETVKPMRLIKKIIQIWCPPNGTVLDPFAGSGTTGHAVLELNKIEGSNRRFILIEQGRPERGDPYAKTLTAERIRRVIKGQRVDREGALVEMAEKLPGTFRYARLMKAVDAEAVLALEREEMIDLLLTSYWDNSERSKSYLRRLPAGAYKHLFAVSNRGEGYFLVWSGPEGTSNLGRDVFRTIVQEALSEGLAPPYHVYARTSTYLGANVEFYQIPHKVLEKLGFNETTDSYSSDEEAVA